MNGARRALAALSILLLGARGVSAPGMMVVCAPGCPGNTAQAQPTMDAFATATSVAAELPGDGLSAVYFEKAAPGAARLREPDATFAMVTLPFLLQYGGELSLRPRLGVVRESGALEVWSLVAKKGRVRSPASLQGWEVAGTAGYSPAFVRGPVLGSWGVLPQSVRVAFVPGVLSALRRAASGETVAALLDPAQTAALASLPFSAELEVVFQSKLLPGTLLCTVGDRASAALVDAVLSGLTRLHERPDAAELLKSMQIRRFEPADMGSLEGARRAFASASSASR